MLKVKKCDGRNMEHERDVRCSYVTDRRDSHRKMGRTLKAFIEIFHEVKRGITFISTLVISY
jgi:hypothetical protein